MKKFILILAFLLTVTPLAIMLTGCDKTESLSDSGSIPTEDSAKAPGGNSASDSAPTGSDGDRETDENSGSVSEAPMPEGEPTLIIGLDGKPVYLSEISRIYIHDDDLKEVVLDALDCDLHMYVELDGVCYLSEPFGIARTSIDNPELFDGSMSFTDIPGETYVPEYKKLKVGDSICGLTVKSAQTMLTDDWFDISVKLGGEVTLTGYIGMNPINDYHVNEGMIVFIIDDKSAVLPGLCDLTFSHGSDYVNVISRDGFYLASEGEPVWVWSRSEYGMISLGNEEDTTVDLSQIDRENGYYSKAKITVDNIELQTSDFNGYHYSARLTELKIID